jgi:hypothetical protein
MNDSRFDAWTRRRFGLVAGGTAAALLSLAATDFSGTTHAKKHKQKLKHNQFGCVNVGGKCRGRDKHCCSGVCNDKKPKKGEKDKSRCVAHGAGTCQPGQNLTGCGGQTVHCTTSTGGMGACRTTTGNAGYCSGDGQCRQCAKDADCRPFCGPDAACVVCSSALCEFGTICVGPTDEGCSFPPS